MDEYANKRRRASAMSDAPFERGALEMADDAAFQFQTAGPVVTARIDSPHPSNELTDADIRALAAWIDEQQARLDVAAIVVEAEGDAFCLGRKPTPPTEPLADRSALRAWMFQGPPAASRAILAARVPVVAVVQGDAEGFGCALAGACDITLAASSARFAMPEMNKGFAPLLALSPQMRRVSAKTLAWLAASRTWISADEALAAGLVSKVVAPADLAATAAALKATLAQSSRPALRSLKAFLRNGAELSPSGALGFAEALMVAANFESQAL
jgi:enoyl-CoA hydratase/carnithine racemase